MITISSTPVLAINVNNDVNAKGRVFGILDKCTLVIEETGDKVVTAFPGMILRAIDETDNYYVINYGGYDALVPKNCTATGDALVKYITDNGVKYPRTAEIVLEGPPLTSLSGQPIKKILKVGEEYKITLSSDRLMVIALDSNTLAYVDPNFVKVKYKAKVTSYENENYEKRNVALQNSVIEYACSFVGNPYVWGGTDPNVGADCSGFVQFVMKHFGITTKRVSNDQAHDSNAMTVPLKDIQPGDTIYYKKKHANKVHHVVMYIGGGKVVEAKGKAYGICISDLSTKNLYCVKRYIKE